LNERGGIEMDVTVSRLAADAFLVVTGTAFGSHDLGWLRRQARFAGADVRITDVTSAWACFGLWGPAARSLLAPLTPASLSTADFPYPSWRATTVADVPVRALRVTYVGELGWELYCPTEYGAALWAALAGTGATPGGYRAIESLRLEKGYRAWGSDIGPETTPAEAGLGFAVRRGGGFVGAEALRKPSRGLRCLTLADPRAVALGGEPVRVGDTVVAQVTSGGYGYTVQESIAYAYLPVGGGTGLPSVAVDGDWIPAEVAPGPLYDPRGTRIRA
jgi:glycine cleavage system aminomethyltransferase T